MSRPKGTTKETMVARRTLEALVDLKQLVSKDLLLEAVNNLTESMRDPNAGAATRRLCSKDIIEIYFKLHKDSLEVLAEVKNKKEAGSNSAASEQEETPSSSTAHIISLDYNR